MHCHTAGPMAFGDQNGSCATMYAIARSTKCAGAWRMAKGSSSLIAAVVRANLGNAFAGISNTGDEPRPRTALGAPCAACLKERKLRVANVTQTANEPAHIKSGRATAKSARRFFKSSILPREHLASGIIGQQMAKGKLGVEITGTTRGKMHCSSVDNLGEVASAALRFALASLRVER